MIIRLGLIFCFFLSFKIYSQKIEKISISNSSVLSISGNTKPPYQLGQNPAADPFNGLSPKLSDGEWFSYDGVGSLKSAKITLTEPYIIKSIFLYDKYGVGNLKIFGKNSEGNFLELASDNLELYEAWKRHDINFNTSELKIEQDGGNCVEIIFYGYPVSSINLNPIIDKVSDISIEESQTKTINISATDPLDKIISFSIVEPKPSFLTISDISGNSANLNINALENTAGNYNFLIKATNSDGDYSTQEINITINTPLAATKIGNIEEELKRFYNCSSIFLKQRPSSSDAIILEIKNRTTNGTDACLSLISNAQLNPNTGLIDNNHGHNETGHLVLKSFNDFHRSWFTSQDFNALSDNVVHSTYELYDNAEMALHLTRSLLRSNTRFDDIFKHNVTLKAARYSKYNRLNNSPNNIFSGSIFFGDTQWSPPLNALQEMGIIEGIYPQDMSIEMSHDWVTNKVNLFKNHGGGILGSPSFIMLNHGNGIADGRLNQPRRWSQAVLRDLMCIDLPAIYPEDATEFVKLDSTISFRKGSSCMQCHSTIDRMAGVLRNITPTSSGGGDTKERTMMPVVFAYDSFSDFWPESSSNYSTSTPEGVLYFRDFVGNLHESQVNGLSELGKSISQTDQPYVCAASRYIEFLTGIKPNIKNLTISNENLSTRETEIRNFAIFLGITLKETQSLKHLVRDIIQSELFIDPLNGEVISE